MTRRKDTSTGLQTPAAVTLLLLGIGSTLVGALYLGPQLERLAASVSGLDPAPRSQESRTRPVEDSDPVRIRPEAGRRAAEAERPSTRDLPAADADAPEVAVRSVPPDTVPTDPEADTERAASDPEREPEAAEAQRPERDAGTRPKPSADARPEGGTLEKPPVAQRGSEPIYKVQLGRFRTREEAEELRQTLQREHQVEGLLVDIGGEYTVQTGAFRARGSALNQAKSLRGVKHPVDVVEF